MRVTISRYAPLNDLPEYKDEEEPKEQEKQPEKEQNIGLTLKKEQELKKNKAITKTENKPEN